MYFRSLSNLTLALRRLLDRHLQPAQYTQQGQSAKPTISPSTIDAITMFEIGVKKKGTFRGSWRSLTCRQATAEAYVYGRQQGRSWWTTILSTLQLAHPCGTNTKTQANTPRRPFPAGEQTCAASCPTGQQVIRDDKNWLLRLIKSSIPVALKMSGQTGIRTIQHRFRNAEHERSSNDATTPSVQPILDCNAKVAWAIVPAFHNPNFLILIFQSCHSEKICRQLGYEDNIRFINRLTCINVLKQRSAQYALLTY